MLQLLLLVVHHPVAPQMSTNQMMNSMHQQKTPPQSQAPPQRMNLRERKEPMNQYIDQSEAQQNQSTRRQRRVRRQLIIDQVSFKSFLN